MKNKISIVLLAIVATLGVQKAMAWATWGHHVTAYIAEKHLTPEAKEKCQHYLKHSLPHFSSWQDYWRHSDPFKEIHHWHMNRVNKSFKTVGVKGDVSRDAVTQIDRIVKEMSGGKYKQMSDSLVKINLQYLIHMIGDHHCPVHVRWNKESHPQYFYSLQKKGKKLGYHSFWDGSIGTWRKGWTAEKFYENMEPLSKSAAKKVQKGSGYDWTQETADVSRYCFTVIPKDTEVTKLSKETVETVHQIVDKQMLYAAYRLAGVLTDIFTDKEYKTGKK